jgi:FkbM family methyltransferase
MRFHPKSILRGLIRRTALLPFYITDCRIRAQVLEELLSSSVTKTSINTEAIRFFTPTPLLLQRANSVLEKEPDMIRWINSFSNNEVMWDIGANVGVFGLYAAVTKQARVLAFEPSAANFFVLSRNVSLNDLNDRFQAYCIAFAGDTELGSLTGGADMLGGAMSQFGKAGEKSRYWMGGNVSSHGMIGLTMDEFVTRFNPLTPTRLKIDVDGLEWPILQGARRTLSNPQLQSAMIELSLSNKEERSRAIELLDSCGLRFIENGEPQGSGSEWAANHLFTRKG